LQEEQRAERRAAKDASAALSAIDKSTFASRQQALFTDAIKAGFREVMRADAQVGEVGHHDLEFRHMNMARISARYGWQQAYCEAQ
jgi:hypothetical protein